MNRAESVAKKKCGMGVGGQGEWKRLTCGSDMEAIAARLLSGLILLWKG